MWRVYTVCHRFLLPPLIIDLPGGSDGEASAYNAGDLRWIPGSGRSSGEGNGNPLQYYLPVRSHGQRSLIGYSLWGCKESDTTERLHFHFSYYKLLEDSNYVFTHFLSLSTPT